MPHEHKCTGKEAHNFYLALVDYMQHQIDGHGAGRYGDIEQLIVMFVTGATDNPKFMEGGKVGDTGACPLPRKKGNSPVKEYKVHYHRTVSNKLATATIEVPADSSAPLSDATDLARGLAPEGTVFFVMEVAEDDPPAGQMPLPESFVIWHHEDGGPEGAFD